MSQNLNQTTLDTPSGPRAARAAAARELRLVVVAHPDLARVGARCGLPAAPGESWGISRLAPDFHGPDGVGPIADPGVSRAPLELSLEPDGLRLRPSRGDLRARVDDAAAKLGERVPLEVVERGFRLTLNERVALWVQLTAREEEAPPVEGLLGVSAEAAELRRAIHELGPSTAPVLLMGRTGVGKERVARALHAASPRQGRPFVAVNLAAVSPETAISQLFGHARGAFTGATDARDGWFEQAHGGTLFLDEIGDLPLALQPALLRALESGEVQPVGGRSRQVDVRVIAATDVDLNARVADQRFRESLYFRLAQRVIRLPSLRERQVDIPVLWAHFVTEALRGLGAGPASDPSSPWMPVEVIEALLRHTWPGNVRELRAAAEAFAEHNVGQAVASVPTLSGPAPATGSESGPEVMVDDILDALEAHDWAILPTSRALGVSRNTLRRHMEQRGLRRLKDVPAGEVEAALAAADGDLIEAARRLRVSASGLRLWRA